MISVWPGLSISGLAPPREPRHRDWLPLFFRCWPLRCRRWCAGLTSRLTFCARAYCAIARSTPPMSRSDKLHRSGLDLSPHRRRLLRIKRRRSLAARWRAKRAPMPSAGCRVRGVIGSSTNVRDASVQAAPRSQLKRQRVHAGGDERLQPGVGRRRWGPVSLAVRCARLGIGPTNWPSSG